MIGIYPFPPKEKHWGVRSCNFHHPYFLISFLVPFQIFIIIIPIFHLILSPPSIRSPLYVLFLFLLTIGLFFPSLSLSFPPIFKNLHNSLPFPPSFPMSNAVEDLILRHRHRHSDFRFHLLQSHSHHRDMSSSSASSSSSSAPALPPLCLLQCHRPFPPSDQSNACNCRHAPGAHSTVATLDVSFLVIFFVLMFVCFMIPDVRSIFFESSFRFEDRCLYSIIEFARVFR